MSQAPILLWFRRDLRLDDHPALSEAALSGRPVIPVFIHDETVESLGAAPKWRLGLGLEAFAGALERLGTRLILRRGRASEVIDALISETGAGAVFWTRYYEPSHIARDRVMKVDLAERGIEARSFAGALLFEPKDVTTGAGTPYSVFTPFWRSVRARDPGRALPTPTRLAGPVDWPRSEALADWRMGAAMQRGAAVVLPHLEVGEERALARLDRFFADAVEGYAEGRDFPMRAVTSGLSENLAWGEISPRRIWHRAVLESEAGRGRGPEKFLSELGWREFAWHLMTHQPKLAETNWRADWDGFPWRGENEDAEVWRRALTGEPFVDAGLREMYVTGRMHNRVRMVVASYLTKHLLTDWRVGLQWFADCLVDWDPAANALGWQWVAGSGPDAAPYFRVFNPETQGEKFDPDGRYRRQFIAEGQRSPGRDALGWFEAIPKSWGQRPDQPYPARRVALAAGREAALGAYERFRNVHK